MLRRAGFSPRAPVPGSRRSAACVDAKRGMFPHTASAPHHRPAPIPGSARGGRRPRRPPRGIPTRSVPAVAPDGGHAADASASKARGLVVMPDRAALPRRSSAGRRDPVSSARRAARRACPGMPTCRSQRRTCRSRRRARRRQASSAAGRASPVLPETRTCARWSRFRSLRCGNPGGPLVPSSRSARGNGGISGGAAASGDRRIAL